MDKGIKMKIGAGLAALAVIIGGGGYYYFNTCADSPDHAISAVSHAIEKHNVKEFHRVVDVDGVLDSGYDGFIEGITSFDSTMPPETRDTIKNFTQMMRAPMMTSVKAAIDSYVETGDLNMEKNAGVGELVQRTGLNDIEVRGVKNIEINDANPNAAFADLILFQPELGGEFPIQLVLTRDKDTWQVSRVQNFQEYVAKIAQARKAQVNEYVAKVGEINARHDAAIREAEQQYGAILTAGNLAQDSTRAELKKLVVDVMKKDWETRKQELFALPVPKDAVTLSNLYMKICDMSVSAADDFAKWLDDRNSATIKSAEEKIHEVHALLSDAAAVAKRMTS